MQEKILNITNGDYFNKYFLEQFGGIAIPFCEVMMDGEVVTEIYSKEFIKLRSKELNVSQDEYKAKMYLPNALLNDNYSTISLWFGKDTFCQMNLLTLLAYLEQIKYQGKLILNYIDDESYELIESNIPVVLGGYSNIFKDVLISKTTPKELGVLNQKAINLYFDYHSKNCRLIALIKNNAGKTKSELISLLLKASKDYGLSDLQIARLINCNT